MCVQYIFKFKSLLLSCFDHSNKFVSTYRWFCVCTLDWTVMQDAPLLTTLSCENEHLLAVRVMYIF